MKIHFIGINGVSMRVLAELQRRRGHTVTGSDATLQGHNAQNVEGADLVVYTAAVGEDNPELLHARRLKIPVVERARFLGEIAGTYDNVIAVSGTHGKTTTTGMLWNVFAHLDPTVHIGGSLNDKNGAFGGGKLFITEACEYKRNFLSLAPDTSIILNIDLDHTDCYKDIFALSDAFKEFADQTKGLVIVNGDDINTAALCFNASQLSVGLGEECDFYARDIFKNELGCYGFSVYNGSKHIGKFSLSVPGKHNIYNALAAIACADYYGISPCITARTLSEFRGIDRRFQYLGDVEGARIFTDYAHHPKEIVSSITSAKDMGFDRITIVFEPHTYTRTASFLEQFADALSRADEVILLPIYAAREKPALGITSQTLQQRLTENGKPSILVQNYTEAITHLKSNLTKNQIIIFTGAGTIDQAAQAMLSTSSQEQKFPF